MTTHSRPAHAGGIGKLLSLILGFAAVACLTAPSASAACLNEAFRVGPSALLPECRAYEMVSPVDKGGGAINMSVDLYAPPSGDGAAYWSAADFAGAVARVPMGLYIGRRGAENWTTKSGVPPVYNGTTVFFKLANASPDLSKSLQYTNLALTPGAIEGGSNLYLQDNETGERELVAADEGSTLLTQFAGFSAGTGYSDGTADWSNLTFITGAGLLDGPNENALYEYAEGELRLVSRLQDGTPSAAHLDATNFGVPYPNSVSSDGSRIFWVSGSFTGNGVVYMREDGTDTVPISASQKTGEVGTLAEGKFGVASDDGSLVYFTSGANLTDASATGGVTNETLYRYDVETGVLTDLLAGLSPTGARVERVLAASQDGAYVYFAASGALTPDSEEAPTSGANVYVWHEGQVKLIAALTDLSRESSGPSQSLASPSGEHFAFATKEPLASNDPPSEACRSFPNDDPNLPPFSDDKQCADVYRYDAVAEQLSCVTCNGSPGLGDSELGAYSRENNERARAVLDNGTVFADTPNRLLAQDVNGVTDPYAWREGALTLLSTGTHPGRSLFGTATPDGSTVFVRTAQSLVPQDVDGSVDLYAVRVEGGLVGQFPPPAPPPCAGEACRGPAPSPAPRTSPESTGPGRDGDFPAECLALERRARAADRKADALARKARRASGKGGAALRRKAKQQRRQANRLTTNARNCGGEG